MLLSILRRALRRLLTPLVKFATDGTKCEWHVCDDEAGVMLIVIIDGFGQTYALPQTGKQFRAMALAINQMADENDPQIRSL